MIDLVVRVHNTMLSSGSGYGGLTTTNRKFGKKYHAKCLYSEGDNLRDDHIDVPAKNGRLLFKTSAVGKNETYHFVISNATIMSSFKINAVNEMATMFKNSFSNRTKAMIMIAAPW